MQKTSASESEESLSAELDRAREREAATREILSVISQSRDDDAPVFDLIAQNAAGLCGAAICTFWRVEDGLIHYCASHGLDVASFAETRSTPSIPLLDSTLTGQVVSRRAVVRIEDATAESYLDHEWARRQGLRQLIGVPIFIGDEVWGSINLMWPADRTPGDADIQLVESFADQASIAIENVRQFRELQTRLAREAATREVLEVISQSRDDEGPVFDVVLRMAAHLCGASLADLCIISEDRSHAVMVAEWGEMPRRRLAIGDSVGAMGSDLAIPTCLREGRIVHLHDLADTDLYRSGDPIRVTAVDEEGIRTFLVVPLFSGGQTVGSISIYRREVKPFSADEIALVETFAAQAVIAIENVRQFRAIQNANAELETRLAREAATREILEVISQSRDDDAPVFDVIVQSAARLCKAPITWLVISNDVQTELTVAGYYGLSLQQIAVGETFEFESAADTITSLGLAILEARTIQDEDLALTPAYLKGARDTRQLVDDEGMRTRVSIPLISGGKGIGAIILSRREVKPFSADEIALVETFAAQAVIAIENVRQFRELQTRLAREAATREILEVISRNPDDDRPVFDVILRNVIKLCAGDTSALLMGRKDDARMTMAAWRDRESGSSVMDDAMIAQMNATEMLMDPAIHVSAQAIVEARNIHVLDVTQHPSYLAGEPSYRIMGDALGVRSALFVPLIDARGALGTVHVHRREVRPFTDDEIALVETFAAQAVIAIENVRQFRELQTRLAREAAMREILEVISHSRDDDRPVFDVVLRNAAHLCSASMANLNIISEDRSHAVMVADWGDDDVSDQFPVGMVWPMGADNAASTCMRDGRIVYFYDLADTDLYRSGNPLRVAAVDDEGIRTFLAVPLFSGGQTVGCISIYRREVRAFTPDEVALVETFAAQAVIAIENVRQFRELQTRLAREKASAEILEIISQSRDDESPVFDMILRKSAELCGAFASSLVMGSKGDSHQRMVGSYELSPATIAVYDSGVVSMDPDISITARAILTGKVIHVDDMIDTDGYRSGNTHFKSVVDDSGIRTNLFVPLISSGNGIGALVMFRKEVRPYTADQIALVETFAAQAVIAIENVRQFRELQTRLAREAALREILSAISKSTEDETLVFDTVLKNAVLVCGADQAALILVNDARSHVRLAAQWGHIHKSYQIGIEFPIDQPLSVTETLRTAKVVHHSDYAETEQYKNRVAVAVSMVETEGIRTRLVIPLLRGGIAIGTIALSRRVARPFSDDEIALVETFAAQAVIAIENVRQFRELQTRLEREAATREILEVISQSRDDDRPVFDVVLRKAADLCGASMAGLNIISEDRSHAVMVAEWGDHVSDLLPVGETVWPMSSDHAPSKCMREGRIVHVHDLADTDLYRSGDPIRVTAVDTEGIRTFLAVPLFSGGVTVSCISIYRREVKPFSADEIALVETFAAQAVIAIENVRQFRELQTRLEREAATREILEVISQSRDDDRPVFDVVLRKAAELCNASMADLEIISEDRSHTVMVAHWGETLRHHVVGASAWPMDSELANAIYMHGGRIVHVHDMADTDLYRAGDPNRVADVDKEGIRTFLAVPLFSGGRTIGCITLYRREVAPFAADQIALAEIFAAQAVIAIENVRQFRELQTRLEREAATRNVLRVISESPDDEQPTFEAILDSATRLCGTEFASLVLGRRGDATQRMVADRGATAEMLALFREGKVPMDPEDSIAARAILEGNTIHVPDMADTDQYRAGHERFRLVVDRQGLRTNLFVPLLGPEGGIGCFILWKKEVAPFTADQIALMETFATHAVIAIENVRQFRELQTRLAREAATREILQIISQSRNDEGPVFDVILENACRLCDTPMADLILARIGDAHQVFAAQHGAKESSVHFYRAGGVPMDPAQSFAAQAIFERKVIHLTNMAESDLYLNGSAPVRHFVDDEGTRTILFVPLIANDEAIGVIVLFRHVVDPFDDAEIALVETFAAQAVIAIENVRQFKALEALNAELGDRVQEQVGEIERMGRLKRFLPAAVADTVISSGSEKLLSSHRALLGVLFCDIRGFTAFCETAEPEETIEVLQTYHEEMGKLINAHGAGVDHRMGDGIMVLFNDPLPCDDPAGDAVRLAMAMRARMAELCHGWKRMGHRLGFGMGVSLGYATVGMVGFEGRFDYTASGTAINLASRLCDEAQDGEILISPRTRTAVEGDFTVESRGEISFKGIREPVEVFCVTGTVG